MNKYEMIRKYQKEIGFIQDLLSYYRDLGGENAEFLYERKKDYERIVRELEQLHD